MSFYDKIVIASALANSQEANEIATASKAQSVSTQIVFLDQENLNTNISDQILNDGGEVILLVSDNYLKSEIAMEKSLLLVQDLHEKGKLIVVVVDGHAVNKETGDVEIVPTSFDKLIHVMNYMNFWQERYLDFRKNRIGYPANREEAFQERLRTIRAIQSDIGEFLRFLRSIEYFPYANLKKEGFAPLFGLPIVHVEESSAMEIPKFIQNGQSEKTSDSSEIDVNTIPGMDLLHDKEKFSSRVEEIIHDAGDAGKYFSIDDLRDEEKNDPETKPSFLEQFINENKDLVIEENEKPSSNLSTPTNMNDIISEIQDEDHVNKKGYIEKDQDYSMLESIYDDEEIDDIDEKETVPDNLSTWHSSDNELNSDLVIHHEADQENDQPMHANGQHETSEVNMITSKDVEHKVDLEDTDIEEEYPEEDLLKKLHNYLEDGDLELEEASNSKKISPDESAQLIHQALLEIDDGELDKGLSRLKEILETSPSNTVARFQYAKALAKNAHNLQMATEQLELLLDYDRYNSDAYFLLADLAEQHKDYLLSQNYYEKVAALNPDFPGIYYKLGQLTLQQFKGQKKKAAKFFKKAIEKEPALADAHYHYANIMLEHFGKYKKALYHYEQTLLLNPEHPRAWFEIAVLFYEQNEKAKAYACYLKACQNNPSFKTTSNDEIFYYVAPPEPEIPENEPTTSANENHLTKYPIDNGKVVLITGASSGIGMATAETFAKEGYRLILTGRREERLEDLKLHFEETYNSKVLLKCYDVRSNDEVVKAIQSLDEEWSHVDILINNAGLAKGLSPIHEGKLDDWDTMIDTNIKGLLYMTRAIAPFMVKRRKGHIINICSIAGTDIYPMGNVYCATKAAVDALTRAMRMDLYKYNIRVSQVSPGHVEETEFALVRFDGDKDKANIYEGFQPLKASDVAEAIQFIANRPVHVNVQDVYLTSTQQASVNHLDRTGRESFYSEKPE